MKKNRPTTAALVFAATCLLLLLPHRSIVTMTTEAKELVATHQWQRLGPTDTLPAGLEIRMDLEHGGTWARLPPPPKEESSQQQEQQPQKPLHHHRCGPSCHERLAAAARRRGLRGSTTSTTMADKTTLVGAAASGSSSEMMVQRVFGVLTVALLVGWVICKHRGPKLRDL